MKTLKYQTIEIKEFPLTPDYSGDPFTEYEEYIKSIKERDKDILTYRDEKIGKDYYLPNYPQCTNIPIGNNGEKAFYRISQRYYSRDNMKRILISEHDENEPITAIFQIAIIPTCEQKKTK